jgi:ribosome maturation factor RimP
MAKSRKRGNQKRADDEDDFDSESLNFIDPSLLDDLQKQLESYSSQNYISEGANPISIDNETVEYDDEEGGDDEEGDDDEEEEGVDIDDIIVDEDEEEDKRGVSPVSNDAWKSKVQSIILNVVGKMGLFVHKLVWLPGRIEIIISANADPNDPVGPSVSLLQEAHTRIYEELDVRESELACVTRFEILVASPGIGEVLRTDQDFISFKGFLVTVTTTEEYKKKTKFEGTLVERLEDVVSISQKGRIVKIPRELIDQVRLPKPKYEPTDTEMRKLR